MKISSHQIAAFTEVFRLRSISRAAATLGVTQSAVTQHLAKLERHMGTLLFVRYRTGLEPTRPALDLFALTDRMRVLEQLLAEKMGAYGALSTGHLTIVANAPRPVMPLISAFCARYPGVKITFSLLSWTLAMQRIEAREVDIAVITEPGEVPGLFREELTCSRYTAMVRCDHPLAIREQISLSELAGEMVIVPEEGSLTQRVVRQACANAQIELANMIEMTSFAVVKEAVLHGIGIGILLDDSTFPAPDVVLKPIAEIDQDFRTYLVTPGDKRDLRFVRAFIDVSLSA